MRSAALILGLGMAPAALAAVTVADLQAALEPLVLQEKVKVEFTVASHHKGTAPLHWNEEDFEGKMKISAGPKGVRSVQSSGTRSGGRASVWKGDREEAHEPELSPEEAEIFANPAGVLLELLPHLEVTDEREETLDGQPVRLVVLGWQVEGKKVAQKGPYLVQQLRLFLDADGVPLHLEQIEELTVGRLLGITQRTNFRFAVENSRLVVTEADRLYDADGAFDIRTVDEVRFRRRG